MGSLRAPHQLKRVKMPNYSLYDNILSEQPDRVIFKGTIFALKMEGYWGDIEDGGLFKERTGMIRWIELNGCKMITTEEVNYRPGDYPEDIRVKFLREEWNEVDYPEFPVKTEYLEIVSGDKAHIVKCICKSTSCSCGSFKMEQIHKGRVWNSALKWWEEPKYK